MGNNELITRNNNSASTKVGTGLSTWLSPEDLEFVKKQFFPITAQVADIENCLTVARTFNLNPILKQIYFVGRKAQVNGQWFEKVEPMVGRDGFLNLAHRSGKKFAIKTTSAIQTTPKLVNGQWQEAKDLVATCTVNVDGMEFVVEVAYGEYVQKTKEGNPTKFWAEKPDTMLKKVAESQALRKAFNVHGLYSAEELGVGVTESGEVILDTEVSQPDAKELPKVSPVHQIMKFLGDNGLNKTEQGKFMKEHLKLSSADVEKITAWLEKEDELLAEVMEWRNPPAKAKVVKEEPTIIFETADDEIPFN